LLMTILKFIGKKALSTHKYKNTALEGRKFVGTNCGWR
jgi:hypothetical protein